MQLTKTAYLAWEVLNGTYARKQRRLHEIQTAPALPPEAAPGITHGARPLQSLAIDSPNVAYGVNYQTAHPGILREMLRRLALPYEQYTFVDLGCGEGLPLATARGFGFKHLIGVEFAEELCAIARENAPEATIHHLDATQYDFPNEPLIVFLFNPFKPPVLKPVLRRLRASIQAHPRPVYVLYLVPMYAEVFTETPLLRGPSGSYYVYRLA